MYQVLTTYSHEGPCKGIQKEFIKGPPITKVLSSKLNLWIAS